jgi:hypothetical protein
MMTVNVTLMSTKKMKKTKRRTRMKIKTQEQYDSLKMLLMIMWELTRSAEVAAESNDLWDEDFEMCGECDHAMSDCRCRNEGRDWGGREYDDGDSFE